MKFQKKSFVAKGGANNSTTFRVDNFRFGDQVQ